MGLQLAVLLWAWTGAISGWLVACEGRLRRRSEQLVLGNWYRSDERSVTSVFRRVNFRGVIPVAWYVADLTGQIRGLGLRICQDM